MIKKETSNLSKTYCHSVRILPLYVIICHGNNLLLSFSLSLLDNRFILPTHSHLQLQNNLNNLFLISHMSLIDCDNKKFFEYLIFSYMITENWYQNTRCIPMFSPRERHVPKVGMSRIFDIMILFSYIYLFYLRLKAPLSQ